MTVGAVAQETDRLCGWLATFVGVMRIGLVNWFSVMEYSSIGSYALLADCMLTCLMMIF